MKLLPKALPPGVVGALLFCLGGQVSAAAVTNYVAFGNFYFNPKVLTNHVGDTVIWTNAGGFHTVTGGSTNEPLCGCTSGTIQAFTNTFTIPGIFPYYCYYHRSLGMTGEVVVVGAPPVPGLLTNGYWTNGDFVFSVLGTANQTNVVQAAANLAGASNWVSLDTNVPATNVFIFTDTNAARFPRRFYRVVEP